MLTIASRVHARGKGAPKKKREAPSRSWPQHVREKYVANLWDSGTTRKEEEIRGFLRCQPCTIATHRTIDAPNIYAQLGFGTWLASMLLAVIGCS